MPTPMPGAAPGPNRVDDDETTRVGGYTPPARDCARCRLGSLAIPTSPGDVRGWETPDGRWERLYRTSVVQGDGPIPCSVMLVGEAPGQHEDREGVGFRPTAPAGRVLRDAMEEVGLFRVTPGFPLTEYQTKFLCPVYITNALKCRPVDNKIDKFLDCLETCRSTFLIPEIEAVNPKVVVLLGKTAAQPYFGKESSLILRQNGEDGRVYIHAPHPSHIARGNADARPKLVEALKVAKEIGYG